MTSLQLICDEPLNRWALALVEWTSVYDFYRVEDLPRSQLYTYNTTVWVCDDRLFYFAVLGAAVDMPRQVWSVLRTLMEQDSRVWAAPVYDDVMAVRRRQWTPVEQPRLHLNPDYCIRVWPEGTWSNLWDDTAEDEERLLCERSVEYREAASALMRSAAVWAAESSFNPRLRPVTWSNNEKRSEFITLESLDAYIILGAPVDIPYTLFHYHLKHPAFFMEYMWLIQQRRMAQGFLAERLLERMPVVATPPAPVVATPPAVSDNDLSMLLQNSLLMRA